VAVESVDYREKLQNATTGLAGRIAETYKRVCPVDGTGLVDGLCKVCGRQIQPAGPDTSKLSEQEAKQITFWSNRLKSDKAADRAKALSEIRKIQPDWQPSETPKSATERTAKFFQDVVTTGPNGEQIKSRRLIEMG
jgi:hypothetical protein